MNATDPQTARATFDRLLWRTAFENYQTLQSTAGALAAFDSIVARGRELLVQSGNAQTLAAERGILETKLVDARVNLISMLRSDGRFLRDGAKPRRQNARGLLSFGLRIFQGIGDLADIVDAELLRQIGTSLRTVRTENLSEQVDGRTYSRCRASQAEQETFPDIGPDDRATLYSSTEYKKVRLHYFTPDYADWETRLGGRA